MAEVTDEELAAALKAAEDESGIDQRVARATAAMTPEQRRQSEESVRRWIEAARRVGEAERAERTDWPWALAGGEDRSHEPVRGARAQTGSRIAGRGRRSPGMRSGG